MKRLYSLILIALLVVGCGGKQQRAQDTAQQLNDSLLTVVAQKDSMINEAFASMSAISENLGAIKSREKIINTEVKEGEIPKHVAARINEDIEAINRLLEENRETINRLEKSAAQLKKANIQVVGMEKVIAQLNLQIDQQDQEINQLKNSLHEMKIQVTELNTKVVGLNTKVSSLAQEKASLQGEVQQQTDILNTGYYIIGSESELLDKEIVYKSGFIGRTLKINENRSLDSFTMIDIRSFDRVVIGNKKTTLISSHPTGSYEFTTNDKGLSQELIIKDKQKFWEYSKVLVISYK